MKKKKEVLEKIKYLKLKKRTVLQNKNVLNTIVDPILSEEEIIEKTQELDRMGWKGGCVFTLLTSQLNIISYRTIDMILNRADVIIIRDDMNFYKELCKIINDVIDDVYYSRGIEK